MKGYNISAISTAPGTGGVAIIRVSGESPLAVAERIFTPSGGVKVFDFTPNRMYTGVIHCDGFDDFGLCVYFKAPASFTGEDVVELHCHGGVQIARGVLNATLKNGAVAAERGEFTKRAFLNGKLSLSSAEGMIDMINAESLAEIRAGSMLYSEKLTQSIKLVQAQLKDVLAGIAADIDYPEEDIEATELSGVREQLAAINCRLRSMLASYEVGKRIKCGVTVALCGAPNVGKSSLLNAILGYDKAIVSPTAGTTRDAVEGSIEIEGVKYNLVDTAGLRERADEIESIGIRKAKQILASADVILYVCDGSPCDASDVDLSDERVIKVFNKCDINLPGNDGYDVVISAATGENLDKLKRLLTGKAVGGNTLEKAYIIEERHFSALERACSSLTDAVNATGEYPLDIVSLDIHNAWATLGEITGETATEEIIDTVFAKFCVGK